MSLPSVLKNFGIFADGLSWIGQAETIKLPKLSRKTDEYRGAGMDGPVELDLGSEKLEMEVELAGFHKDAYSQYGGPISGRMWRYAGAYAQDDTNQIQAVEVVTRGRYKEIDPGDSKGADKAKTTYKIGLTYYKLTVDGEVLVEIDHLNFIFNVGGVDMLAAQRKAIGLA